jgi:hypothetical protein
MAGVLAVVISAVTTGSALADDCELPRLDGVWTDDGTKQEVRITGQVDADLSLWVTGNTTLEGHYRDRWDDKSPGWKDIT